MRRRQAQDLRWNDGHSRPPRRLQLQLPRIGMATVTRPPRPARSIRVEDQLWDAALDKAGERGEVLSEEIRKFLTTYINRKKSER